MKVKCVLLKGDWDKFELGGVYEAQPMTRYGFRVEGFYTHDNLEVEGYENECKFEVCDD